MSEKLITPPAVEPITLQQAKDWGIVETSAYDDGIEDKIKSAREWVEGYIGRALVAQTWRTRLDRFPTGPTREDRILRLNRSPLQSVTSISYYDTDGNSQTLATAYYDVDTDSEPARIAEAYGYNWPDTYPRINAVTITSVHGYEGTGDSPLDLTNIPQAIKDAIAILVAELYQNRERSIIGVDYVVNSTVESLLWPYQAVTIIR